MNNFKSSAHQSGTAGLRAARSVLMTAAFLASILSGSALQAATLNLSYSGILGATSTINGTPLAGDTPFRFDARFDTSVDSIADEGRGLYAAAIDLDIEGYGSFRSLAGAELWVYLLDLSNGLYPGYGAGIYDLSHAAGFIGVFTTATPDFDADAPTPSLLTGAFTGGSNFGIVIPLEGGGQLSLDVYDLGKDANGEYAPASITATPEPSTLSLAVAGGGLVAAGFIKRRNHSARQ